MTQTDLQELLSESRFSPFVITMTDGFAVAIHENARKHMIAGRNLAVVMDSEGNLIHIPYRSISHITEPKT